MGGQRSTDSMAESEEGSSQRRVVKRVPLDSQSQDGFVEYGEIWYSETISERFPKTEVGVRLVVARDNLDTAVAEIGSHIQRIPESVREARVQSGEALYYGTEMDDDEDDDRPHKRLKRNPLHR